VTTPDAQAKSFSLPPFRCFLPCRYFGKVPSFPLVSVGTFSPSIPNTRTLTDSSASRFPLQKLYEKCQPGLGAATFAPARLAPMPFSFLLFRRSVPLFPLHFGFLCFVRQVPPQYYLLRGVDRPLQLLDDCHRLPVTQRSGPVIPLPIFLRCSFTLRCLMKKVQKTPQ